jgi:Fe(3+) dicitrate transport protein
MQDPEAFRPAIRLLTLTMAAALNAPVVLADDKQSRQVIELPRISVINDRADAIAQQPGSIAIVGSEQLERIQPLSTEDALRRVPGVHIKGEEETSVVGNVGIRGLSASDYKTLILEDGVPIAPGLFVGNGRYYNPRVQRMEEIEVLKGAAALRYGPNTIGGVINYKTRDPIDGFAIGGRIGTHNYRETIVEAGGATPSGEARAGLMYTYASSDGFQDKDFDMQDFMAKAGMALGDKQWLGAKFTYYKNDANISYRGLFPGEYNAGVDYNPAPDDYFLTERTAFDVNHLWEIRPGMSLSTVAYWSQVSRDYWRFGVDSAASTAAGRWVYTNDVNGNNRAFDRIGIDSRLTVENRLFGVKGEAEIGMRIMEEEMHDQRVRATRATPRSGPIDTDSIDSATSYALFAQNRFDVTDRLSITPGLRIESYEQEREDRRNAANNGDSSNTEYLPGIGATYKLTPAAQFYGSVYKAFSPPLNSQSIVTGINQQLDAEHSINVEIGVRGRNGGLGYEFTAFQMDFDNQITPEISGGLSNANAGSTLHRGLEAAMDYRWKNGFRLGGNLTWIPTADYQENRGGGILDGNRLPYSPELLANLAVGYGSGPLDVELAWQYVDEQYGDGQNNVAITQTGIWGGLIPSYDLLNLTGSYAVNKQFKVFASVKNLADERYIAGLRQGIYAGPERSFELGARYQF